MAELVDALVSNTNEVTLVPVRLRLWVLKPAEMQAFFIAMQLTLAFFGVQLTFFSTEERLR